MQRSAPSPLSAIYLRYNDTNRRFLALRRRKRHAKGGNLAAPSQPAPRGVRNDACARRPRQPRAQGGTGPQARSWTLHDRGRSVARAPRAEAALADRVTRLPWSRHHRSNGVRSRPLDGWFRLHRGGRHTRCRPAGRHLPGAKRARAPRGGHALFQPLHGQPRTGVLGERARGARTQGCCATAVTIGARGEARR